MSLGLIDNINFQELEAEKYWAFSNNYKKDSKKETHDMIFSGEYVGARKMDGAYYRFIKDMEGNMRLQGRSKGVSGEYLDKYDWVPQLHSFFESLPNGTCLLGELYFPENEGSSNVTKIMGCLMQKARDRQEKGDKLHYYIFDVWAFDGKSYLDKKIEDRIDTLIDIETDYVSEYVEVAAYFENFELWEQLQIILANGGEGIVITKKGTVPEPGKRKARKTLKIKRELANTIDCFFTGGFTPPAVEYTGKEIETWQYWKNLKTGEKIQGDFYTDFFNGAPLEPITKSYFNNWAGSLEIGVVKGDKVVSIGTLSGLSDEIKSNPKAQKGKVIEITAMEILPTGGLRHAKMVNFRPDKNWKECKWEDIFGKEE